MKLQFDSSQKYQLSAIQSVVDIFEGQPICKGNFANADDTDSEGLTFSKSGIGNRLIVSDKQLLENIKQIQTRNNIKQSDKIELCNYLNELDKPITFPNHFTVEMETGIGKTYTYLRTIYELNKVYGFLKFVIVVPSVAIREGVVKNLEITNEHFQNLYGKPSVNFTMYNSRKIGQLRNFANVNAIQILVINIDSFTKDTNIINSYRETGLKPIEYIQNTYPVVIVDEPQNMETDIRKAAIHNLNPLCTIRYSATHKNFYNLVYSLNPVQAYDLGLVKQIEVDGITSDKNYNDAFIQFKSIQQTKTSIKAKLNIYINKTNGVKENTITAKTGDDLLKLSNNCDCYKEGFIINRIDVETETVEFSNGVILKTGQSHGGLTDEILKYQIERTIKWHFEKEKQLNSKGIKVLSLFFIDRVENYREYNKAGHPQKGKLAKWFEEIFPKYAPANYPFAIDKIHNGYFSKDKKGIAKNTRGNTKADADTYSLIMKDKERLLSIDEPLRFIFSHSALREGWDNPNVFQICTLNESKSELRKRQEIGRGLRLPVDNTGKRVWDKELNLLTVIANESYADFSKQLQKEIEEETSVDFGGRIRNARKKSHKKQSKEINIENFPQFFHIWKQINSINNKKTEYTTENLISKAVAEVKKMPDTVVPKLVAEKQKINYSDNSSNQKSIGKQVKTIKNIDIKIPDVYKYIQNQIDITRNTIFEILKQSGRYDELLINPQLFLDNFVVSVGRILNKLLIYSINTKQINGNVYSMMVFHNNEIDNCISDISKANFVDKLNNISDKKNTKSQFAQNCEADFNVKFFFELPKGFEIKIPNGNYTPHWGIVFRNDKKIYFTNQV